MLSVLLVAHAAARRRVGIAYCDLGALYDTVPSPFYDDRAHTPEGAFGWTAARYESAAERIASLIDSLAMPLVGLYGVETERVALDLAARSCGEYCVLHRTLNSLNGLDFALLYQGDRFLPAETETGAGWMSVEGLLDDLPVVLLLCRRARFLEERVEELRERCPDRRLIILGDPGGFRGERYGLRDALLRAERAGRGTRLVRGGWEMEDRILVDSAFRVAGSDVYAREWLFDRKRGEPRPLGESERRTGGRRAKLPVFVYLLP